MKSTKNGVASIIMLVIVVGIVVAWSRVNSINTVDDFVTYFRTASTSAQECVAKGKKYWFECYFDSFAKRQQETPKPKPVQKPKPKKTVAPKPSASVKPVKPTKAPAPVKPTKAPAPAPAPVKPTKAPAPVPQNPAPQTPAPANNNIAVLQNQLNQLPVGSENVNYNRKDFKHWSLKPETGCDTRRTALIQQGMNVKHNRCKILSGTWNDPYSVGVTFNNARETDLDHVIPLKYAARHGAYNWSAAKREEFANDLSQLLIVSAKENRIKSDKGAGDYMPPNKGFWCEYSKIWVKTATKYGLSVDAKDKVALSQGLNTCKN